MLFGNFNDQDDFENEKNELCEKAFVFTMPLFRMLYVCGRSGS